MTVDAQWTGKTVIIVIPAKMISASVALRIAIHAMRLYVLAVAVSVPIAVSLSAITA